MVSMVSEPMDASACPPHCGERAKGCPPQGDCGDCKMQGGCCGAKGEEKEAPVPLPPEADAKKAEGNTAFQAKQFEEASRLYAEAIAIAEAAGAEVPGVYFSNRAVCLASLQDWEGTRADAAKALARVSDLSPAAMKKALFQKARAELRLELQEEYKATLHLAQQLGVRAEVERLVAGPSSTAPAEPAAVPAARAAPAAAPVAQAAPAAAPAAPAKREEEAPPAPAAPPAPPTSASEALRAKEAGTARYKEGNYRAALTEYRRAVDLVASNEAALRAQLLGNVAAACLMLKRTEECVNACTESLALDPSNGKVRARLASAQVASGDFDTARSTLGNVSADDAVLQNALKQVGSTQSALAEADKALSNGEPAKALHAYANLESTVLFDFPPLTLKMAQCYLELKQYPRVLSTTQQILRGNPRNTGALVLRTQALYRNSSASADSKQWVEPLEQGQRLLKEALSLDPDHAEAQALRKRLRALCTKHAELKEAMDNREFEKGQQVIDGMLELCPESPVMLAALHCERAKACMRLKDWRGVLKDVGQATYRNHSLVQPYLYRAQAMQALDRHEDAVKELESLMSWHQVESVYHKLEEAKFLLRKHKRRNYYEVLGVPSVASNLEIKKAYREKATEWHPDKKSHLDEAARKNAEEMFKLISEAYEVLTDTTKKELYEKGYDLEGINEQIEIKKRRTNGCCGGRPGGCH